MAQLGIRSPLFLAKLGHDLRPVLDDTLRAPLPERMQRLSDEIDGYVAWRDVGAAPQPERGPEPSASELWQDALRADAPFSFT